MGANSRPTVIAVAGKGGVGKTTIGGLLVRYLVEEMKKGKDPYDKKKG
jgi:anion-transporting  ArsA/GET3 family ATPase